MSNRQVTERDFRMPEFRDADPKDYEFREDGAVVRKDRWEQGLRAIASTVIRGRREWEISEVVEVVRALAATSSASIMNRSELENYCGSLFNLPPEERHDMGEYVGEVPRHLKHPSDQAEMYRKLAEAMARFIDQQARIAVTALNLSPEPPLQQVTP